MVTELAQKLIQEPVFGIRLLMELVEGRIRSICFLGLTTGVLVLVLDSQGELKSRNKRQLAIQRWI